MPDTPAKRRREAQKRRNREDKAKRKQLRKDGLLESGSSGLFAPGEQPRECVPWPPPQPRPPAPPAEEPAPEGPPTP